MRGLVILAFFLAALGFACSVTISTDRAYVDRNSGTRWGYREWPLGLKTGQWMEISALEVFMRTHHPSIYQKDPVSCRGAGRSLLGLATVSGHGSPGPILSLTPIHIDQYCQAASDQENLDLYRAFSSGNETTIQQAVDRVFMHYIR